MGTKRANGARQRRSTTPGNTGARADSRGEDAPPPINGAASVREAEAAAEAHSSGITCPRRSRSKARAAAEADPNPEAWPKENRADVYAEDVRGRELREGYTSSSFPWRWVFLALALYGVYLVYTGEGVEEITTSVHLTLDSAKAFATGSGNTPSFIMLMVVAAVVTTAVIVRAPSGCYLVDFALFEAPESWRCDQARFNHQNSLTGTFTQQSMDFQNRILSTSTLENTTSFPPAVMADKIDLSLQNARQEATIVICGAVEKVFRATGISPKSIDCVVVNCSLFSPTPSLSSIIINKFKMRSDVLNYSLGGMGCSAGVISIDVASRVLRTRPNTRALVVSTECMTENWYHGNERAFLISNCIFRVGGSAVILSNRRADKRRSMFKLEHIIRTHMGKDDEAYDSVVQDLDKENRKGVRLSKKVMVVAGDALRSNMTRLGPLVLPVAEQFKFLMNMVGRKMTTGSLPLPTPLRRLAQSVWLFHLRLPIVGAAMRAICSLPPTAGKPLPVPEDAAPGTKRRLDIGKPYVPDFRKAFDVFCVHAGGRAVLDAIEKNLSLTPRDMEPSRATLARYGNTSSSSIWYELDYARRHMGLRSGQKAWQIAFGSGFMCNSCVWKVLRTPHPGMFDPVSNHAKPWTPPAK